MKNEFLKFSSKWILFSTMMASAMLAGSPQRVLADTSGVQIMMQSGTVKGQITDTNGEPVIGASIQVKGTNTGVISDINGNFVVNAASNATLVVSYIGYKTQEVHLNGKGSVSITLQEDSELLDEVVVMAYTSTVKRKVVASVTNVDMKQIEQMSGYKDLGNALQGRVPGVIVTNKGGGPDATLSISIRGGGDPMYVIDGIVRDKGAFLRLSSQDIESMSIMKDAASSAVYGASAANGIIVVTTKKGREGKMRIGYTFDGQYNVPTSIREKYNSLELAEMQNAISDYMGSAKLYSDEVLALIKNGTSADYPNTDWWDKLIKKGVLSQRHTLNLDGGSKDTQYRVSFMVYDQGTLQKKVVGKYNPKDYKTYSLGINLNHHFRNAGVKLGVDLRPYLVDNKSFGGDVFGGIISLSPLQKTYNSNGTYAPNSPMATYADTNGGYTKDFNFGTDARLNLEWDIKWIKGLKGVFWGNYALGSTNRKEWTNNVPTYNEDGTTVEIGSPILNMKKAYNWVYEFNAGLQYDQKFAEHNLSLGLFYNQRENYSEDISAKRINYFDNIDQLFAGPTDGQTNAGGASEGGRLGYVGTLSYDYAEKYLLSASFRYDGNDGFAKGDRWGFFPSVALGYMVSNENFMNGIKSAIKMDMFKLRGSIGQIGETSSRFDYLSNWGVDQNATYIGGAIVPGVTPAALTSKDLSWYTTTTWNIGVDFGFFNNHLTGSVDYFFRRTKGYLISPVERFSSTLGNHIGRNGNTYIYGLPKIKSDDAFRRAGAEFFLNWKDRIGNVTYSVGANLTFYDELWEKNEAEDNAVALGNPNKRKTHVTIGQGGLVYLNEGLFRNSDELLNAAIQDRGNAMMAGDMRFVDVNGDGVINEEDMVYDNKSRKSIMQWGIPFSLEWKAWSVEGLFQGSGPQYGLINASVRGTGWGRIYYKDQLDFYHPGNVDAKYPRADNSYGAWNGELNRANSDFWRVNRTYARLKNLSISYNLKQDLLKKIGWVGTARIGLTGTNLFTICPSMKYGDPETGAVEDASAQAYPVTRTYSLVINLGF